MADQRQRQAPVVAVVQMEFSLRRVRGLHLVKQLRRRQPTPREPGPAGVAERPALKLRFQRVHLKHQLRREGDVRLLLELLRQRAAGGLHQLCGPGFHPEKRREAARQINRLHALCLSLRGGQPVAVPAVPGHRRARAMPHSLADAPAQRVTDITAFQARHAPLFTPVVHQAVLAFVAVTVNRAVAALTGLLLRQASVGVVVVNVPCVLAGAIIRPRGGKGRVRRPVRQPVARRVGGVVQHQVVVPGADEPARGVIAVRLLLMRAGDAHQQAAVAVPVSSVEQRVAVGLALQLPAGAVARGLLIRAEGPLFLPVQAVAGELRERRVAELHSGNIAGAVGEPLHRGQAVGGGAGGQPRRVIVPGGVMPQQRAGLRVLHRLALKAHPALLIILILHGDAVPVADVAGFSQPALFAVAPLLCRFTVHGAPRQAVRRIVMPQGDEAFILAADKLPGEAVPVALRSAVKARFLRQPVQQVVGKGGAGAVLINKPGDASGGVVFHPPRQAAGGGAHRAPGGVILRGLPAAVRADDGGQVAGEVVFIAGLLACGLFLADQPAPGIVGAELAEPLLVVNGRDLPEAVVLIAGQVAGAVRQGQQLAVAAPGHVLLAAGRIRDGRGQVGVRAVIRIIRAVAVAGDVLHQAACVIECLPAAQAVGAGGGDKLVPVVIAEAHGPPVRGDDVSDVPGADIQPVFGSAPGGIGHRHQAARAVKLPGRHAAVGFFFPDHPLEPAVAAGVQHLPAVQAVGDGDGVFLIPVGIAEPLTVVLRHHAAGGIVAVGGLRAPGVLVRRHTPRVLIVIREAAHPCAAAVIHGRQLAARGVGVADQRQRREVGRVFRVTGEPHRLKADAVVVAIPGRGQGGGQGGKRQPEAAAGPVGDGGDVPGELPAGLPVKGLDAPEAVGQPGQDPVRRRRGGQGLPCARDAPGPAEYPPGPRRAAGCQVKVRAQPQGVREGLPQPVQRVALVQAGHAAAGQPQGLAAAEGGFAGLQRREVNAAPAVIVKDKLIIAKL